MKRRHRILTATAEPHQLTARLLETFCPAIQFSPSKFAQCNPFYVNAGVDLNARWAVDR